MAKASAIEPRDRTPIGERAVSRGIGHVFDGVTRKNMPGQVLAGVTLLAIAIPEQLATSQLAGIPAFAALVGFIGATLVFMVVGSNPVMSVGADSTIAPLFAVALLRVALPGSAQYYSLVAITAVVTGILVAAVGLLKLGWLADFLSIPIVTGFLCGIGVIIVVHQLPHVLGVSSGGGSVVQRLEALSHHLGHVSVSSLVLALATLGIMVLGEKINPRLPWALGAVVIGAVLASALTLSAHGVQVLGTVKVGLPQWRLSGLSSHDFGAVVTTSLTLLVVIMSQSAATARTSADELGVADDVSRDFVGIGLANVVTGLLGTLPVDASPARTTVTQLAGGRTKMVALVAGLGALVLSPLASVARFVPLASLAGVLLFIAGRLIKISRLSSVWRSSRVEFALALITWLGVMVMGVEVGLGVAVALAILSQTWHASRPRMIEMGRRRGTTSWEPSDSHDVDRVESVLVVVFDEDLFFANAGIFRRELHAAMQGSPATRHVVIDAVAISEIDFTAMATLTQVVHDMAREDISLSLARANVVVRRNVARAEDAAVRAIKFYDSVDEAVTHSLKDPQA